MNRSNQLHHHMYSMCIYLNTYMHIFIFHICMYKQIVRYRHDIFLKSISKNTFLKKKANDKQHYKSYNSEHIILWDNAIVPDLQQPRRPRGAFPAFSSSNASQLAFRLKPKAGSCKYSPQSNHTWVSWHSISFSFILFNLFLLGVALHLSTVSGELAARWRACGQSLIQTNHCNCTLY